MRSAWTMRPTTLILACVAAASCATAADNDPATTAPLDGNSFAIRNVRVFDGHRTIDRTNVVVKDGRIESVGGSRIPAGLPVIDGSGQTLIPGLIDSHAHVQSETALNNALRFGVTTQLDMFTRVDFAQAHRPQRNRLSRTDLSDLYSAGAPVTSPGGMGTQFGLPFPTIGGPGEASDFVRARIAEGSDYIKILHEPDAGIVTTISTETLAAVVAEAHAQGKIAVVHITSLKGAREVAAAGADGLAHLFGDSVIDDALLRKMAAQRMFVIATLSLQAGLSGAAMGPQLSADPRISSLLTDGQRTALKSPSEKMEGPMAPYMVRFNIRIASENVRRLHAAGVRILAGDDTPNLSSHGVSLHGEMQLLAQAGLTPAEALEAATQAPAETFGLSDRGRITPGARADLVLVNGNPLADITATRGIARIFKNGYEVSRTPRQATPPKTQ